MINLHSGETSVIAGIYGPIEARIQRVLHNKAAIQATFGPIKGPPSMLFIKFFEKVFSFEELFDKIFLIY